MENNEYKKFQKSIEHTREFVVQIKGAVEGVSNVKKNRKAPVSKTNKVIAISKVNVKD